MIRVATAATLTVAFALAGCDDPPPREPPANRVEAPYPDGSGLAKLTALPLGQQQLVLFRAIRDAGEQCQGIVGTTRAPDDKNAAGGIRATWRATCQGDLTYLVQIGRDGIAQVTGPLAD